VGPVDFIFRLPGLGCNAQSRRCQMSQTPTNTRPFGSGVSMDRHISADRSRADCFFSPVAIETLSVRFMALCSMPLIYLSKPYMCKANTAQKLHYPDETKAALETINFWKTLLSRSYFFEQLLYHSLIHPVL
jgi:hypothetical protein